ncbi:MAG TPA: EF-P lysine aminoacylase GenX [Candidatus Pacebacteria bacterium]|nr:EF-P lysine aminoacylase GenX [Candidatus Paceibacterota bacterium]HAX01667.1 EF-P lysine aminoacylase GenX [Candidatus Paceibacterota bacterium]
MKLRFDSSAWHKYMKNFHIIHLRERIIGIIRAFLKREGFHEVETPKLLPTPSTEPFLEVFETQLKFSEGDTYRAFLPSSPEFALKKLLAKGFGSCFEICKSFRNGEGRSSRHSPEFTILEFYHVNGNYETVMRDVEQMFQEIAREIFQKQDFLYQGRQLSVRGPWERLSVSDAFKKYANIDQETLLSTQLLLTKAKQKGYTVTNETTWEEIYNQILFNEIEPHLGQRSPTFLYDYPISQAAFAQKKASDPRFAERFELFWAGYELGNCFSELIDPIEQRKRCEKDLALRRKLRKTTFPLDEAFIHALEKGFPPTGGIALGLDRIIAIFADTPSIHDTILFPVDTLFPPEV